MSGTAVEVEVVVVRVCEDVRDSVEVPGCCCEDDGDGPRLEDVMVTDVASRVTELEGGLPDDEGRSCD